MNKGLPLAEIKALIGTQIGRSDWFHIDQDRIDRFGDCTEDRQWIHVDPVKAVAGPFGKTIAHGFLTLSLIPFFSEGNSVVPENSRMVVNYGLNKVRLIQPVPVGAYIRDILVLNGAAIKDRNKVLITIQHTIEIRGESRPACVAEVLRMYLTDPIPEGIRPVRG